MRTRGAENDALDLTDAESIFLRRAADAMREDAAWNPHDFLTAVADWLESEARRHDGDDWSGHEHSLIAARAYMGTGSVIPPAEGER